MDDTIKKLRNEYAEIMKKVGDNYFDYDGYKFFLEDKIIKQKKKINSVTNKMKRLDSKLCSKCKKI